MTTRWTVRPGLGLAMLVLGASLLAGCGGSSTSGTGPSGGSSGDASATVQGQVVATSRAKAGESRVIIAVRHTLGVGLAEAQLPGSPVAGATVRLKQGTTVVATTTTDSHGQFAFRGVTPSVYTIEVEVNSQILAATTVTVGAGDQAIVGIATNGATTVQVTAMSTDVYNNDAQLGHAVNIANASSSCDPVRVTQLRAQGLGWGDIAHRCNVSPGVIGLGRSNFTDSDLDDVRERGGHGRKHGKAKGKT